MITIWCEYDYGQEGLVFTTEEVAEKWLKNAVDSSYVPDAGMETYEELDQNGLISFDEVAVITEEDV